MILATCGQAVLAGVSRVVAVEGTQMETVQEVRSEVDCRRFPILWRRREGRKGVSRRCRGWDTVMSVPTVRN